MSQKGQHFPWHYFLQIKEEFGACLAMELLALNDVVINFRW